MGRIGRQVSRVDVYFGKTRAGFIERTSGGSFFQYDQRFLDVQGEKSRGIAYCLPLRPEPYMTEGASAHPFFSALLPEGPRRGALAQQLEVSPDDLLTLLVAVGSDCVGKIAVVREGQVPEPSIPVVNAASLDAVSFDELWEQSLEHVPGEGGEQVTVPGVQRKLSGATARQDSEARAFILKLASPGRPRLVENEHFFMSMARSCGLETARVELVHDRDGTSALLVERFDRLPDGPGLPRRRVHQEDGCQLLGRPPADKHVVTVEHLADAMKACDRPSLAVASLIKQVAFAYLIGNGELHGRDVSVRTSPETDLVEPCPAYDMVSTIPFGVQTATLTLDGRDAGLTAKHFTDMGASHGLRSSATAAVLDELCEGVGRWIDRVSEIGYGPRKSTHLRQTMDRRRKALSS